jgi:alpha-ribazole phosphatase/probable phosphoglycerate mutase
MSTSDRPLTPYGQRQAAALARFFDVRKIDAIVHTGLARTRDTALAIRAARKIELAEDAAWREAAHGAWEGLT